MPTEPQEQQPAEAVDEAAQLEARRKRREAIRAKYKSQATPLHLQAVHAGDSDSSTPGADSNRASASQAASGKHALFSCGRRVEYTNVSNSFSSVNPRPDAR